MRLYIKSEHDDGTAKATGPLHSLQEAGRMMDRIAKVKDVTNAECWYVNREGEAVGGPIYTYARGGA